MTNKLHIYLLWLFLGLWSVTCAPAPPTIPLQGTDNSILPQSTPSNTTGLISGPPPRHPIRLIKEWHNMIVPNNPSFHTSLFPIPLTLTLSPTVHYVLNYYMSITIRYIRLIMQYKPCWRWDEERIETGWIETGSRLTGGLPFVMTLKGQGNLCVNVKMSWPDSGKPCKGDFALWAVGPG